MKALVNSLSQLCLTLMATLALSGQVAASIQFETLAAEHGLSMNTVNDLVTDQSGYLWVATQAGLNRYNGAEIKVYLKNGNSGPSANHISHLYYSKSGQLWLSTLSDGINRYDHKNDAFEHFKDVTDLPQTGIQAISEDNEGNIWFGSDQGIFIFDPKSLNVTGQYKLNQANLSGENISHIYFDDLKRVWVAHENGLQLFDSHAKRFHGFQHPALNQPIHAITQGEDHRLWVANEQDALICVSLLADQYSNPLVELKQDMLPASLTGFAISDLQQDRQNNLWIAFANAGLGWLSQDRSEFKHLKYEPGNITSLRSTAMTKLWLDEENQLWIGSKGDGLSKTYLNGLVFNTINQYSFDNHNLLDTDIRSIYRDSSNQLWIGTAQGLYLADESADKQIIGFSRFEHPDFNPYSFISFIKQDAEGTYWIGTRGEGLYLYDSHNANIKQYRHNASDPKTIASDYLYSLYFDNQQQAWVTTKDGGLSLFLGQENGFRTWAASSDDSYGLPINEVTNVLQDDANNYWILTYGGGLIQMTPQGKMTEYSPQTLPQFPSKHLFKAYIIDEKLWISSSDGVFAFDPNSKQVQLLNKDSGLIDNVAYLMLKDNIDQLWIGTSNGLSVYNPKENSYKNYTDIDGLQANEFNFGAGFVDSDNRVYLGGINGFNHILVSALPPVRAPKTPVIDEFLLLSKVQQLGPNNRFSQAGYIGYAKMLNLSHKDALFAFKFHSVHLHHASQISYEYRMQGLHNQWFSDQKSYRAHFTGLAPGQYQFQVRARNINQQYSPTRTLDIYIAPAPWQTWWAYLLYLLAATVIVWLLVSMQLKKFRTKVEMMEKVAKSEQRLQLSLWGSGDEFWDWDLAAKKAIRSNVFLTYPEVEKNLAHTLNTVVHPDDLLEVQSDIEKCLKLGKQDFELTYRGLGLDGSWIWVLNRGKVVERDEQGRPKRITGTIKNIQTLKETEAQLKALNIELEDRVKARTEELQLTRDELIDKEKMATLGGLVASITHEINTPIGISVTAISHLADSVDEFNRKYDAGEVSHEDFQAYQDEVADCTKLVLSNLNRASTLIQSFKKVSVDQSHEDLRDFNLKHYLDEIFVSLKPLLSRTPHNYHYECPDDIMLHSHPGAFYQIISNLINNSIIHGFKQGESGNLSLTFVEHQDGLTMTYQDDGHGMTESVKQQIFTPFFTTKRGKGGSGLGMNILFNLVNQVLKGKVDLITEPEKGAKFVIELPKQIYSSEVHKD
ncbi:PAS domain-containing protein [Shewanella sp. WXL01]|uniref:two-component regulator propeller domain-containing protein n=1 Tax=Shewanella sp. WXL01 TaxID=2709721 RepID=UPI0014383CAD|nr:two-component regulator propeller domain-containing protein [Shewanella sp. WXL01]NKF49730.1 PAS domain-containing protein [Shewanella sp. WXL01]